MKHKRKGNPGQALKGVENQHLEGANDRQRQPFLAQVGRNDDGSNIQHKRKGNSGHALVGTESEPLERENDTQHQPSHAEVGENDSGLNMQHKRKGKSVHALEGAESQPLGRENVAQHQASPAPVGGTGSGSSSSSGQKKVRGPTRLAKLLSTSQKLQVQFNEFGQPVGPNASKYTNLMGTTVRSPSFAPLYAKNWDDVLEEDKDKLWRFLNEHSNACDGDRAWAMKSLGKKLKDYRKKLKDEYYSIWNTNQQRLLHRPPDVKSEHWALLVQYWSGSKAKAASTTNTANRGKQEIKHSGGTKSFANHLFEETQRRTDGSIPTLADLFLKTHTRKDGTRVDAKSAEIIDQMVDLTNREGGSLTNISDSVYHQVMGPERHGRVRGYGLGPTPTTVFGAKYTQSRGSYAAVCNQLDEMRQLMEDMKKKHAEDLEICKAQLRGEMQNEMRQMMQSMMSGQHQYTSDGEEDS